MIDLDYLRVVPAPDGADAGEFIRALKISKPFLFHKSAMEMDDATYRKARKGIIVEEPVDHTEAITKLGDVMAMDDATYRKARAQAVRQY